MRLLHASLLTLPLSLTLLSLPASARDWQVDPTTSTLGFVGTQSGAAFEGQFRTWSAQVTFDPATAEGSVSVTVDTGSAITFNADRDGQIGSPVWFDVASFPQATWTANSFTRQGGNRYLADGTLTLKGVDAPVSLPFTLEIDGDQATVSGETSLTRTTFNVGTGQFASGDTIGLEVKVTVSLSATAQ